MYGLNFVWFLIMIGYFFIDMSNSMTECMSAKTYRKAYLFLSIKRELEALLLIRIQSDITLRQVNICSNTVFTILVIFSPSQASCFDGASSLALSIAFVNFAGYGFFTFLNMGEL